MSLKNKVAIVGADETDEIGIVPNMTPIMMHAQAARNALRDAGIDKSEVDGVFTAGAGMMASTQLCEYLGIIPKYTDSTMTGGSSFVIHVEHAAAAIAAGLCNVALITHGETGLLGPQPARTTRQAGSPSIRRCRRRSSRCRSASAARPARTRWRRCATCTSTARRASSLRRSPSRRGSGRSSIRARSCATTLTIDDVLASRWVAYPFHIFDCCLVTDAGGAVVVVGADRARAMKKKPVWVLGSGEASTHQSLLGMDDVTRRPRDTRGKAAFEMAGVTHADIDVVEVYDSFTYTALVTLEELGFCEKGEGGPFVSNQRTAPGGDFPMNTNGGGLSYTHPGMYGMFILIEAVRQLRGECGARQVQDAKLALVNATGGMLSATGTLILGGD